MKSALLSLISLVLLLLPFSASGQASSPQPAQDLIAAVQADWFTTAKNADSAPDADGPLMGLPPLDQLLLGRLEVLLNPLYWSNLVQEALLNGTIQLPIPIDVLRPEIWTPNVTVANGDYISPLPMEVRDISRLSYEWKGSNKSVADFVTTTETDMVNFLVDGVLVGELYSNGFTAEIRHQPWSVAKTFVGVTVGIAYEEGLIEDLHDPIEKYVPDLLDSEWQGVTVENLLQMESGVHWDEETPLLINNTQVLEWVQIALDYYTQGLLGQTRNEYLMSLPRVTEPGTTFHYNSANTQILAWMLENLYGKPYNEILSEKLWQPMGAWGDAKMIADRQGGVLASQGLYARAYDFARFGEVLRNGGVNSDGVRLVSQGWIESMVSMTELSGGTYGYQTWISLAAEGAFQAAGFEGQRITVMPKHCVTAVRLSHSLALEYRDGAFTDPAAYGLTIGFNSDEWDVMVKAVSEQIGGCPEAEQSPAVVSVEPASRGGALSWILPFLLLLWLRQLARSAVILAFSYQRDYPPSVMPNRQH